MGEVIVIMVRGGWIKWEGVFEEFEKEGNWYGIKIV